MDKDGDGRRPPSQYLLQVADQSFTKSWENTYTWSSAHATAHATASPDSSAVGISHLCQQSHLGCAQPCCPPRRPRLESPRQVRKAPRFPPSAEPTGSPRQHGTPAAAETRCHFPAAPRTARLPGSDPGWCLNDCNKLLKKSAFVQRRILLMQHDRPSRQSPQ